MLLDALVSFEERGEAETAVADQQSLPFVCCSPLASISPAVLSRLQRRAHLRASLPDHVTLFAPRRMPTIACSAHTDQDQERDRPDAHVPAVVSRGYLRLVRDEHGRLQHAGVPVPDRQGDEQGYKGISAAAQ
jgi:hypothetical protein